MKAAQRGFFYFFFCGINSHSIFDSSKPKDTLMKFIIVILLLLISTLYHAQGLDYALSDINYSTSNPAFVGSGNNLVLGNSTRRHWSSYYSNNLYAHQNLNKTGGIGISYNTEIGRVIHNNAYQLQYSYGFNVGDSGALRIGISAGFINKYLNWDNVGNGQAYDPYTGETYSSDQDFYGKKTAFDYTLGAMYYNHNFFVGYSALHVTQPELAMVMNDVYHVPMRHNIQVGFCKEKSDRRSFKAFLNSNIQKEVLEISGIVQYYISPFVIGIGYKQQNSPMLHLRTGIQKKSFIIMYGYDSEISMNLFNSGAHEIAFLFPLRLINSSNERAFDLYR